MALKSSEKTLVGLMMIVGGVALFFGLGLPQMDQMNLNNGQIATLNGEIESFTEQKTRLSDEITALEKNTAVPPGMTIRTFTESNREEVIKIMLDQTLRLATDTGNRFISLTPFEAQPLVAEAPPEEAAKEETANTEAEEKKPPPSLATFGYELALRGTYDSLQSFLRAMDDNKELLEVSGLVLENEAAQGGTASSESMADPSAPIRMTAKLRLVLQPRMP